MSQTSPHRTFKIGLTGGIGVGKTAVCACFEKRGVPIIDADLIAREIVQPGQIALQEIVDLFGKNILLDDQSLNRAQLRDIIFNNPEARASLELITHPRIIQRMRSLAEATTTPYCILCIPLLFETGLEKEVDRILVVDVPESIQIDRVMQRDNVNHDQALAILKTQLNRELRLSQADDVIENNHTFAELDNDVATLHTKYLELCA